MDSQSKRIESRKQRWADLFSPGGQRKNLLVINCAEGMPERPMLWPEKKAERIDWIMRLYEWQLAQMEWLEDDKLPFLENLTGTEIFAEAMGSKVFRPADNMPFAMPFVHTAEEAAKIKVPELFESSLALLFEIADEVQRRAGKEALMRLPDIQSPMDITALIWDKTDYFVAMLETPEAVKELSGKVAQLLKSFLDEWFRRYGNSFIAHFPPYYMQGGITLSEDEVGAVGTAMFDEFFLPELCALSERYGGIGIHCCAHARHQWGNFKKVPGLRLINLRFETEEEHRAAVETFADTAAQWHMVDYGAGDAVEFGPERPANARLVIERNAATRDEALKLSETMRKRIGR